MTQNKRWLSKCNPSNFGRASAGMLAAMALALSGVAVADDSCAIGLSVTDVSPNPVYVDGFPADITLTVSFDAPQGISSLSTLSLEFDEEVVYSGTRTTGQGGTPACTGACTDNGDQLGSIVFTAGVGGPGTYSMELTATIAAGQSGQSTTYCDEEVVEVALELVAVEHKAPPAVANEYINSLPHRLNGKVRGCVISTIAQRHGKYEAYGPKGGPYCESGAEAACGTSTRAVHYDVNELMASCK